MARKSSQPKKRTSYQPSAGEIFDLKASKAQQQQIRITEAAISSFAVNGLSGTSFASLARDCEISRPLVHHYFPTLDSLFLLAAKYVRSTMLRVAMEGLQGGGPSPKDQLHGYIKGCFQWARLFPDQAKFWMLFFYQASLGGAARKDNSELVQLGQGRIVQLLKAGEEAHGWRINDAPALAKSIQIVITGALVSAHTEDGYLSLDRAEALALHAAKALLDV